MVKVDKKIIEKSITQFQDLQRIRRDKRYLMIDEEEIRSLGEFRKFQNFLNNLIIFSRHRNIKIKGCLIVEKDSD